MSIGRLRACLVAACVVLVAGGAASRAGAATALPAHVYAPYFLYAAHGEHVSGRRAKPLEARAGPRVQHVTTAPGSSRTPGTSATFLNPFSDNR
jgi:hypothetical protein